MRDEKQVLLIRKWEGSKDMVTRPLEKGRDRERERERERVWVCACVCEKEVVRVGESTSDKNDYCQRDPHRSWRCVGSDERARVCVCACVRVRVCACARVCMCACARVREFECGWVWVRERRKWGDLPFGTINYEEKNTARTQKRITPM